MMYRRVALSVPLVVVLLAAPPAFAAPDTEARSAEAWLERINGPALDAARAVRVVNVHVDMGPGALVLGQGILVPAQAIAGRTLEMVFVGDARFTMTPPDEIESEQLARFAGESPLATVVTHAVIAVGNPEVAERLLADREPVADRTTEIEEADKLFAEWAGGPQRAGFGTPAALVKTLVGEPLAQDYFAVWCRSPKLGDFYYSVDPLRPEQVALGQFVPVDLESFDVWQRNRIREGIKRNKWFGRYADFDLEELGDWDTWVSTSLRSSSGEPSPGSAGFEPEHYLLDVSVDPRYELDAWGTARIRLRATDDLRRSIDLSLYSGLRIKAVYGDGDRPLQWIGSGGAFSVFLPEPVPEGRQVEIRVEYEGDLVEKTGEGRDRTFRLLSTEGWYPHAGSVDRATYDVTLRWSRGFELAASGRVVGSGEQDGLRWERRVLDLPVIGFTFEVGRFDFVRDRQGHVELTFAFPQHTNDLRPGTRERIVSTVKSALPYFEEKFGPYPLDHLTVAVVRRSFSQGYLSMVTLAEGAMVDPQSARRGKSRPEWADEYRDVTIAHELSHQWWGNWVGWDSYRDQWLSEALAEYSALMYGAAFAESEARFLVRNAVDWRDSRLGAYDSTGPVVLGHRLNSSQASDAYQTVVYDKGAVVFRMLARTCGEEPFAAMLGELAKAVANRVIDTATFIYAIERMSGLDLQAFARRYVYGTGIPTVYYRYAVEDTADPGAWTLRGEAFLASGGSHRYRLERNPEGRWVLDSEFVPSVDVQQSSLIVPFQVVVTAPDEVDRRKKSGVQSARGFGGTLVIRGRTSEFEYTIPARPQRMTLDQLGEVLAYFHDESLLPKRSLRFRAGRLAQEGDVDGAEALLQEALAAPVYSERGLAWLFVGKPPTEQDLVRDVAEEDARVHAALARLEIERGRWDAARRHLVQAEAEHDFPKGDLDWNERRVLWSRVELALGDPDSAYARLEDEGRRFWLGAEGQAVLAAAAFESGHDRVAGEALGVAERSGVDVSALQIVRQTRAGL